MNVLIYDLYYSIITSVIYVDKMAQQEFPIREGLFTIAYSSRSGGINAPSIDLTIVTRDVTTVVFVRNELYGGLSGNAAPFTLADEANAYSAGSAAIMSLLQRDNASGTEMVVFDGNGPRCKDLFNPMLVPDHTVYVVTPSDTLFAKRPGEKVLSLVETPSLREYMMLFPSRPTTGPITDQLLAGLSDEQKATATRYKSISKFGAYNVDDSNLLRVQAARRAAMRECFKTPSPSAALPAIVDAVRADITETLGYMNVDSSQVPARLAAWVTSGGTNVPRAQGGDAAAAAAAAALAALRVDARPSVEVMLQDATALVNAANLSSREANASALSAEAAVDAINTTITQMREAGNADDAVIGRLQDQHAAAVAAAEVAALAADAVRTTAAQVAAAAVPANFATVEMSQASLQTTRDLFSGIAAAVAAASTAAATARDRQTAVAGILSRSKPAAAAAAAASAAASTRKGARPNLDRFFYLAEKRANEAKLKAAGDAVGGGKFVLTGGGLHVPENMSLHAIKEYVGTGATQEWVTKLPELPRRLYSSLMAAFVLERKHNAAAFNNTVFGDTIVLAFSHTTRNELENSTPEKTARFAKLMTGVENSSTQTPSSSVSPDDLSRMAVYGLGPFARTFTTRLLSHSTSSNYYDEIQPKTALILLRGSSLGLFSGFYQLPALHLAFLGGRFDSPGKYFSKYHVFLAQDADDDSFEPLPPPPAEMMDDPDQTPLPPPADAAAPAGGDRNHLKRNAAVPTRYQ